MLIRKYITLIAAITTDLEENTSDKLRTLKFPSLSMNLFLTKSYVSPFTIAAKSLEFRFKKDYNFSIYSKFHNCVYRDVATRSKHWWISQTWNFPFSISVTVSKFSDVCKKFFSDWLPIGIIPVFIISATLFTCVGKKIINWVYYLFIFQ